MSTLPLIPPSRTSPRRLSKLFVISGRGAVDTHHYPFTLRPFFERYRDELCNIFPHGLEVEACTGPLENVSSDDYLLWWQPREIDRGLADQVIPLFPIGHRIMVHYENTVSYVYRRWPIREGYQEQFGKVFSSVAALADNQCYFWIPNWNYHLNFETGEPLDHVAPLPVQERQLLTINPLRNSFDVSAERLRIISRIVEAAPECSIFGGEDLLKHPIAKTWAPQYCGPIPFSPSPYPYRHKLQVFGSFKFVIVIENTFTDWYISEKLAEPLAAATVPVYFGNPRVSEYLPDLFDSGVIDGHTFTELEDLIRYLREMPLDEYMERLRILGRTRDQYFHLTSYRSICDFIFSNSFGLDNLPECSVINMWNERFKAQNETSPGQACRDEIMHIVDTTSDADFERVAREALWRQVTHLPQW